MTQPNATAATTIYQLRLEVAELRLALATEQMTTHLLRAGTKGASENLVTGVRSYLTSH